MAYYPEIKIQDILPIEGLYGGLHKIAQDFIAPFHIYLKAKYESQFTEIDNEMDPKFIKMVSKSVAKIGSITHKEMHFEMDMKDNKIQEFKIKEGEKWITAKRLA